MNNWTKISIPCCVRYLSDVTLMTSSLRNYPKMLEIEFLQNVCVGFLIFQKLKKPQSLAPYILNDPHNYTLVGCQDSSADNFKRLSELVYMVLSSL
jgi:hypothetical protein